MADTNPREGETYFPAETERRAETALKRMLATPHQKHKPLGAREPVEKPQ